MCWPTVVVFLFPTYFTLYDRQTVGPSTSVLCDDLEGWDREGGREAQEGGDMGIYVYV